MAMAYEKKCLKKFSPSVSSTRKCYTLKGKESKVSVNSDTGLNEFL